MGCLRLIDERRGFGISCVDKFFRLGFFRKVTWRVGVCWDFLVSVFSGDRMSTRELSGREGVTVRERTGFIRFLGRVIFLGFLYRWITVGRFGCYFFFRRRGFLRFRGFF